MYYNMHGRHVNTLRVYLKEKGTRREKEIFRESGSKGIPWIFYNTTVIVVGRTKVRPFLVFSLFCVSLKL
jgi:hypothetical protein